MTSNYLRGARRLSLFGCAAVSVVVGCSSGGSGDGVTDDGSLLPAGASSISSGKGGAKTHIAGAPNQAGAAAGGSGGTAGAGGAGGTGGKAGAGGSGGKAGAGGSGGVAGAGGTATAGNAGVTGSAGSSGSGAGGNLGSSGTGGSVGTAGSGGSTTCGDGDVQPPEQCDDKGPSPICSNTCVQVSNPVCKTCEDSGTCGDFENNCLGPPSTPFKDAQQTQCYAVLACIASSNCFVAKGTLGGTCYCGSLSLTDCQGAPYDLTKPGAPNGPCAAVIQTGLPGVSTNSGVLGNLTTAKLPAGAAMQRLNCQKSADMAACALPCGLTHFPF